MSATTTDADVVVDTVVSGALGRGPGVAVARARLGVAVDFNDVSSISTITRSPVRTGRAINEAWAASQAEPGRDRVESATCPKVSARNNDAEGR